MVKALLDAKLLPRVLSGSSAGAIVAALICTRTPAELTELFDALSERLQGIDFYASNTITAIFKHLLLKGTLQDHRVLQERLQLWRARLQPRRCECLQQRADMGGRVAAHGVRGGDGSQEKRGPALVRRHAPVRDRLQQQQLLRRLQRG